MHHSPARHIFTASSTLLSERTALPISSQQLSPALTSSAQLAELQDQFNPLSSAGSTLDTENPPGRSTPSGRDRSDRSPFFSAVALAAWPTEGSPDFPEASQHLSSTASTGVLRRSRIRRNHRNLLDFLVGSLPLLVAQELPGRCSALRSSAAPSTSLGIRRSC